MQLEIEEAALKKEKDKASQERLSGLRKEIADLKDEAAPLRARWEAEKAAIGSLRALRQEIEETRHQSRARRALLRPESGGGAPPRQAARPRAPAARRGGQGGPASDLGREAAARERHRRGDRRDRVALDRHPRHPPGRGRTRQAPAPRPDPASARGRPGRGGAGGRRRRVARPLGDQRSAPADRLVPLPRTDGCRQDRARQGPRAVAVRQRRRDRSHRHVRIHGETLGVASDRRSSGLHRIRRGRPAHRGGAPQALLGAAVRRDRKGAPRRVQRPAPAARRRPAHRLARPHGRLQEHRGDHDLERRRAAPDRRRHRRRRARSWRAHDARCSTTCAASSVPSS